MPMRAQTVPPQDSSAPDPRWVGVALLLGVLCVYLPVILNGGFRYDDGHHLLENPAVAAADWSGLGSAIAAYFTDPQTFSGEPGNVMYRPMLMTVNGLTHAIWGFRASGWVFANALLHAGASLLLWRLALRIGLGGWASALAALVFAFHPTASETVAYVSSRSESVAAVFVLLALHAHLSARACTGAARLLWTGLALAAGAAGVLSKETAAGLCAAIGAFELFAGGGEWRTRLRRGLGWGAVHAVGLGLVFWLRQEMLGTAVGGLAGDLSHVSDPDPYSGGGRSVLGNLVVQSRVVVLYLQLYAKPVSLSPDHVVPPFPTITGAVIAAWLVHASIVLGAVVAAVRGHRLLPLCVGWFWVFLAPSVALPLNVLMNEHRMYLPAIAVALLAGAALGRVRELRIGSGATVRTATITVVAPLVLFGGLVVQRAFEWTDLTHLWEQAAERVPESPRVHMNLGAAYFVEAKPLEGAAAVERVDLALASYERAYELNPRSFHLALNMGNAWLLRARATGHSEDFRRAVACYDHLGALVGEETQRWRMAKAEALTWWGTREPQRLAEALAIVEQLDAEDEAETPIYDDMRARVLRKQGRSAEARQALARSIEVDPGPKSLGNRLTLGWWTFEDARAVGSTDPREAERLLAESERLLGAAQDLARETRYFRAPLYLARFLRIMGQEEQAETFVAGAENWGWRAPQAELEWLAGLRRTPGAFVGTVDLRRTGIECGAPVQTR